MKTLTLIASISLALMTGCVNSKPSAPAIWRVSDADNKIYLLGAFHALKAEDYPLSKAVNDAYADAELLVFEVAPEQLQSPELALAMQTAARLPANTTLNSQIPVSLSKQLAAWLAKNPQVSATELDKVKPWYAALVIANTETGKSGFKDTQGVDQHFMTVAGKSRKPTRGLEQASQQIGLFNNMPLPAQIELLQESLQDPRETNKDLGALHQAWKAGDAQKLEQLTVDDMRVKYPDMYRVVNVQRNQAWLPQLQALLDDEHKDDALVVVGSLHLLGPDGVVQGLKAKGYKVERLK